MTRAPVKNRAVVVKTDVGAARGTVIVAAIRVLKRQGKKR
jgi:predicted phosphoribosyltransferase